MPNPSSEHAAGIVIRPYREADRLAVRRICADTGFLGQPIDSIFEDRELFADYLTDYYSVSSRTLRSCARLKERSVGICWDAAGHSRIKLTVPSLISQ